jgi:hypothetical protein
MQGCIAPSEIPGVSKDERDAFGAIAEDIIYADFCSQYKPAPNELYRDANNPSSFLYFLALHNPQFTEAKQRDFYRRLRRAELGWVRPDFLLHKICEKALYEVKPDSKSGRRKGEEKVGILLAAFRYYRLPYTAGVLFTPRDHVVAQFGSALQVTLRVRLAGPGLVVYRLCLKSQGVLELVTILALLRFVVREMNKQRGRGRFKPIDLAPAFRQHKELSDLARALGLTMTVVAATAVAAVGWKFFWKAVVKRFAVREATAAALAVATGPIPIGDLIALGLTIWTIVDIIRLSDALWLDAQAIARQQA